MKLLDDAVRYAQRNLTQAAVELGYYFDCSVALSDIPEMADVSSISVYAHTEYLTDSDTEVKGIEVTLRLKDETKNSKLIHKLAQKFDVKFEKQQDPHNNALRAYGLSADKCWKFEIVGYVPTTCAVVYEEVDLSPEEIEWARNAVPTTKKITKVVCA